ncbi:MAG: hypothetical protein ACOC5J_02935 [Gemmatimonadota bacterium]
MIGRSVFAILATLVAVGCEDPVVASFEERELFRAEQSRYVLASTADGWSATIDFVYENPLDEGLLVPNCNGWSHYLGLERQVDGEWVLAWLLPAPECLSPPFSIERGTAYEGTIPFSLARSSLSVHPVLEAHGVEGTYRILWQGLADADGETLPSELRRSAPFELVEE